MSEESRRRLVCISCNKSRILNRNSKCKKCNLELGLKQCSGCNEMLLFLLEFYDTKRVCNKCLKKRQK